MIAAGDLSQAKLIGRRVGHYFNPECDHCIVNVSGEKLLGGVIFTDFTRASIHIHAASFEPHWFNRDMRYIAFAYPFEQLEVKKLFAPIHSCNARSLEFCRKLGFIEEARIKDVFPNGDLVVTAMARENCRWLERGTRGKR